MVKVNKKYFTPPIQLLKDHFWQKQIIWKFDMTSPNLESSLSILGSKKTYDLKIIYPQRNTLICFPLP